MGLLHCISYIRLHVSDGLIKSWPVSGKCIYGVHPLSQQPGGFKKRITLEFCTQSKLGSKVSNPMVFFTAKLGSIIFQRGEGSFQELNKLRKKESIYKADTFRQQ
jgi:hypothetical protein